MDRMGYMPNKPGQSGPQCSTVPRLAGYSETVVEYNVPLCPA